MTTLNHQLFKLAAPGCGVICFRENPSDPNALEVILSERAASVGTGLGITGGGFVECGAIFAEKAGFISQSVDEAYRECCEENPGFETIMPIQAFRERAQLVASFCVRANDANGVHACTYFALFLHDDEWAKVLALPPSDERVGSLKVAKLSWVRDKLIELEDADKFFHKHELQAFEAMAQLAMRGKLSITEPRGQLF